MALPKQTPQEQQKVSWPILYLEIEAEEAVIRGVYADGRRVTKPVRSSRYLGEMLVWSPDGRWLAYVGTDTATGGEAVQVMNLEGDLRTIFTTQAEIFQWPIWSPNGQQMAVLLRRGPPSVVWVAVADVEESKVLSRYEVPQATTALIWPWEARFRWSPDGQRILVVGETTVVINTLNGDVETIANEPTVAEWSSTGDVVYYFEILSGFGRELGGFYLKRLGPTGPIELMDRERVKALGLTCAPLSRTCKNLNLTVSPQGSRLAIWYNQWEWEEEAVASVVRIYDLEDGERVALDEPAKIVRTDGVTILALEWAPTDDSFGAAVRAEDVGGIDIKLLDLRTGSWTTLARVAEDERLAGIYSGSVYRVLSWTQ
jgi:Tol biopolymer transport system component